MAGRHPDDFYGIRAFHSDQVRIASLPENMLVLGPALSDFFLAMVWSCRYRELVRGEIVIVVESWF